MKMEPLHSGSLKIWMSHDDMHRFGLSFATMSARDTATRQAIFRLLHIARRRHIFPDDKGLTIELLPVDSGCLLLLTPGHRYPKPAVYAIHTADDLLRFGDSLAQLPVRDLPTASLFGWDEEYRLILYPDLNFDSCKQLLSEFAEPIANGYITAAYTEEHGRTLAVGNALERLLTAHGSPQQVPLDPPH